MKNNRRIYLFLTSLVLGIFIYYSINYFTENRKESTGILVYFFILNLIFWGFILTKIIRSKAEKKWMKLCLIPISTILFFMFLVGVDKLFSLIVNNPSSPFFSGIIFPPNIEMPYQTTEFSFHAKINSLGIRGNNLNPKKDTSIRIVVVGDSFTFGWGVDFENNYGSLVQKKLNQKNIQVEVVNLGQPGGFTLHYWKNLERGISFLNPDLVIIGLLQGNDLRQMIRYNKQNESMNAIKLFIKKVLIANFGNIKSFYTLQTNLDVSDNDIIKNVWKKEANDLYRKLTPNQLSVFNNFEPELRELILEGKVSSYLMSLVFESQKEYLDNNNPALETTQAAIEDIVFDLTRIKKLCSDFDSKLLLINIPYPDFFSKEAVVYKDMNYLKTYDLITKNKVDSIYQSIADRVNVPIFHFTNLFKNQPDNHKLFYPYDGHYNVLGHELLSDSLSQIIKQHLLED